LLLIDKAVIDPANGAFLAGYDGKVDVSWLAFLMARLALALFLVSSALAAYDRKSLSAVEIAVRLVVAVLILFRPEEFYGPAIIAGIGIIGFHVFQSRSQPQPGAS
jgi:hypothetical protein